MDWSNEPYVRLYTRTTADDLELSWQAMALWRALLCEFDRSGLLSVRNGWASVARVVRIPVDVVQSAGAELVKDGRVRMTESGVFCPNFVEAQTVSKSDKARQKESRDRRRAQAESSPDKNSDHLTDECHATSQTVTGQSHAVTPSHSLLCSADPLLNHCVTKDREAAPPNPTDSPGFLELKAKVDQAAKTPRQPRTTRMSAEWTPREAEREKACQWGVDCDKELVKFRLHYMGSGKRQADWNPVFENWLIRAHEFKQRDRKTAMSGTEYARGVANGTIHE